MSENEHNKELLRKHLLQKIDEELEKPDCNMERINEYNVLLDVLEEGKYDPDPKRIAKALRELEVTYGKVLEKGVSKKHTFSKWAVVAAACLALLIITPVTVSAFHGIDPVQLLVYLGEKIFSMDKHTPYEFGELTFIRGGEAKEYASIQDCMKQENLDILFPSWLPEGIEIESILFEETPEGNSIQYRMNENTLLMSVNLYEEDKEEQRENPDFKVIHRNGRVCILDKRLYRGRIRLSFCENGYTYVFSGDNEEVLLKIADGLVKGE